MTSGAGPPPLDHLVGIPVRRTVRPPAADVVGTTVAGVHTSVPVVGVRGWTLLVFLSSTCDGCEPLWNAWAHPQLFEDHGMPPVERVVAVTRDAVHERPDVLATWCADAPASRWGAAIDRLVLSSAAWASYAVWGPPLFALVDGPPGVVATEGVAWAVEQVANHVRRAMIGDPGAADPSAAG